MPTLTYGGPVAILIFASQLVAIVHAIKTDRTNPWLYILLFVPGVGVLAYLIVEIFPNLSIGAPMRGIKKFLDNPHKRIERLEREMKFNHTVAIKQLLANEYMEVGVYKKAAELYESCLEGIYKHDEGIQLKLAEAYFAMEAYKQAKDVLEQLKKHHQGKFLPAELLLFAKCAEALKKLDDAEALYREAAMAYPGLEGNYRYCVFLREQGNDDEREEQAVLARRKYDGMYPKFRRLEAGWMKKIEKLS